jgi:hypothetical protein
VQMQRCRGAEGRFAEVQQRCRDAEMQRCGCVELQTAEVKRRGCGDVELQICILVGADLQRCRIQRCRGAPEG